VTTGHGVTGFAQREEKLTTDYADYADSEENSFVFFLNPRNPRNPWFISHQEFPLGKAGVTSCDHHSADPRPGFTYHFDLLRLTFAV